MNAWTSQNLGNLKLMWYNINSSYHRVMQITTYSWEPHFTPSSSQKIVYLPVFWPACQMSPNGTLFMMKSMHSSVELYCTLVPTQYLLWVSQISFTAFVARITVGSVEFGRPSSAATRGISVGNTVWNAQLERTSWASYCVTFPSSLNALIYQQQ